MYDNFDLADDQKISIWNRRIKKYDRISMLIGLCVFLLIAWFLYKHLKAPFEGIQSKLWMIELFGALIYLQCLAKVIFSVRCRKDLIAIDRAAVKTALEQLTNQAVRYKKEEKTFGTNDQLSGFNKLLIGYKSGKYETVINDIVYSCQYGDLIDRRKPILSGTMITYDIPLQGSAGKDVYIVANSLKRYTTQKPQKSGLSVFDQQYSVFAKGLFSAQRFVSDVLVSALNKNHIRYIHIEPNGRIQLWSEGKSFFGVSKTSFDNKVKAIKDRIDLLNQLVEVLKNSGYWNEDSLIRAGIGYEDREHDYRKPKGKDNNALRRTIKKWKTSYYALAISKDLNKVLLIAASFVLASIGCYWLFMYCQARQMNQMALYIILGVVFIVLVIVFLMSLDVSLGFSFKDILIPAISCVALAAYACYKWPRIMLISGIAMLLVGIVLRIIAATLPRIVVSLLEYANDAAIILAVRGTLNNFESVQQTQESSQSQMVFRSNVAGYEYICSIPYENISEITCHYYAKFKESSTDILQIKLTEDTDLFDKRKLQETKVKENVTSFYIGKLIGKGLFNQRVGELFDAVDYKKAVVSLSGEIQLTIPAHRFEKPAEVVNRQKKIAEHLIQTEKLLIELLDSGYWFINYDKLYS